MSKIDISIIIPTYKRENQVFKIIKTIQKQILKSINIEILICDSFSKYNKKKLKINKKNFKVKYINIKKNNLSAKRNHGINKSKYNNIILIDDDCIPKKKFILDYLNDFKKIDDKTILSGIVDYPKSYILNYNHIKYRDQRHFKKDKYFSNNILPDKIVAMNMAFRKSKKISSLGYFNEKFTGYGFEDHEFANRCYKNGFRLLRSKASIVHDEGLPSIHRYSKKYYHLARDGMSNLLKIDESLAKSTIYGQIENNFFIKALFFIPHVYSLILGFEKIIIKTDKIKNFKFLFLYDYLRLFSYIRGYIDRKKFKKKSKIDSWYD